MLFRSQQSAALGVSVRLALLGQHRLAAVHAGEGKFGVCFIDDALQCGPVAQQPIDLVHLRKEMEGLLVDADTQFPAGGVGGGMGQADKGRAAGCREDRAGLARQQPVLAATCTIFLLSLAGIPLTGGFFAKYYMLSSVVSTGHFLWLVIFSVLCAAVSVYYYFRVIQAMYFKEGDGATEEAPSAGFKGLLVVVAVLILLLGIFPQALLNQLYAIVYTW